MLRIALAQVNATVGDLDGNAELIVEWTRRAAGRGARVVVFPEMMLTGYPVEDLALRDSFVQASMATLEATAQQLDGDGLGGIAVVTGYLGQRPGGTLRAGEPVSIISGNTARSAPAPAARRVHSTTVAAFPARSPTVEFTWARAIRSLVTLSL